MELCRDAEGNGSGKPPQFLGSTVTKLFKVAIGNPANKSKTRR
jgi:hypothetical protein